MSQELDSSNRELHLPDLSAETISGLSEDSPKGNPLLRLLASARRHWLMIICVWLLLGVPAAASVWLLVKPTYTASGFVKVEPATAIIFPEVINGPQAGAGFDMFLNTQVQEMSGSSVLTAALNDPALKGLPETDSVDELRAALTVEAVPRTHLLRVAVKHRDRQAAIRLTQAILRAYSRTAGGAATKDLENKRAVLVDSRKTLSNALDRKRSELYALAQKYGATSEITIDALREMIAKNSEKAYEEKFRADAEVIQFEEELKDLRAGHVPTTMPGEELSLRDQMLQSDPTIQQLRQALAAIEVSKARIGLSQPNQQIEDRTKKSLAEAMERVNKEADRRIADRRKQIQEDAAARLKQQLEAAKRRQASFKQQLEDQEKQGLAMGQTGLQIKKYQDELDSIDRNYKIIDQSIGKIDIENQRPERISVNDAAEILPGGKEDKRTKLMAVALVCSLFVSLCLAFMRDLASGRLYNAADVQGGLGLPLLGSIPALDDLRRGRVGEDDFRESYRAIRATLAGASPTGQIPKTLLITSAQAAEGKTSLAVSLAASLAETGCRVLIIDGDVQAPRVGRTLRLDLPFSLRHVLLGERKLLEAVGSSPVPSLDVLLAARNGTSAAGLLNRRRAASLLEAAMEHYEHVVIDSPPVLGSADALIWAQVADGVVLSSFAGHSNFRLMRQASARISAVGGQILGAVMNNLSLRESYYSYCSYRSSTSAEGGEALGTPPGSLARTPCVHLAGRMLTGPGGSGEQAAP